MFQYPKNEHVTLPSVESWGINNNIIKDPPKAIFTRKIDKVGTNNDFLDLVDESGDRVCEGINVYARGVNPFTAVSYDNFSNNAGIKGNPTNFSSKLQASMPYKAMVDGDFRPPVRNPRDLLPLSRQPRLLTSVIASPEFVDFSKARHCPDKFRQIKEEVVKTSVRPTAVFNIQTPIEPFDIGNGIKENVITVSATSGFKAQGDRSSQEYVRPTKGANNDTNNVFAGSNYGSNITKGIGGEINVDTSKYIQDADYYNINSNPSQNIYVKGINEMNPHDNKRYIQDIINTPHGAGYKGYEKNIEYEIDKDRYLQDIVNTPHDAGFKGTYLKNIDYEIDQNRYLQDIVNTPHDAGFKGTYLKNIDYEIEKDRYIQNVIQAPHDAGFKGTYLKNIDYEIDQDRYIQNVITTDYTPNIKGTEQNAFYSDHIDLARVMPQHESRTNISDNRVYRQIDRENEYQFQRNMPLTQVQTNTSENKYFNVGSTNYNRLVQKPHVGGFDPKPTVPGMQRAVEGESLNDQRKKFNDKVNSFYTGRYQATPVF